MNRAGLVARLRAKINRGNSWLTYDLGRLFAGDRLEESAIDELENRLLLADAGVEVAEQVCGFLRRELRAGRLRDPAQLRAALRGALLQILEPVAKPLALADYIRPFVLFVVGVNGVGKTTTIGKLAARYRDQGRQVMIAAGDTFRAAAVDQLRVWAQRVRVPIIAQDTGADAASVIYDAVSAAKARGVDLVIADTAGRLNTQSHLMDELRKIKRVVAKQDAFAPHEVLLVVDATTGSNALNQALAFHEAVGLTGVAVTKLDGTAKGGVLLAIAKRLALPVRFIGVGEAVEDLLEFDAAAFADALIAD